MITVTTVVEHIFCPKFTYYGHVLGLKQFEDKRGTVTAGRNFHIKHEKTNTSFMIGNRRKNGKKLIAIQFYSIKYNLSGKIDEAIETADEIILIERKYSDTAIIGETIKVQIGLLSVLIEENLKKPVNNAIVIFSKNKRQTFEIKIDNQIKNYALKKLEEVIKIIKTGAIPDSWFDNRCIHCCYRRVCPIGSLNT